MLACFFLYLLSFTSPCACMHAAPVRTDSVSNLSKTNTAMSRPSDAEILARDELSSIFKDARASVRQAKLAHTSPSGQPTTPLGRHSQGVVYTPPAHSADTGPSPGPGPVNLMPSHHAGLVAESKVRTLIYNEEPGLFNGGSYFTTTSSLRSDGMSPQTLASLATEEGQGEFAKVAGGRQHG